MKKILGLDVGTNSVGWAMIEHDFDHKKGKILGLGSRILPMSQDMISDFNKGNLQSSVAHRTGFRGVRRLRERQLNRRKRLIVTLKHLGFIEPEFEINNDHSLAYKNEGEVREFRFQKSYNEMCNEFLTQNPNLKKVTHDWTIYYLRKKALSEKITPQELAWVILQFNTKRGYYQLRGDQTLSTDSKKYFVSDYVDSIIDSDEESKGQKTFFVELRNEIIGEYKAREKPDWIGKRIDFIVTEKKLKDGSIKTTISSPDKEDWTLRKKKTESEIIASNKTVGQYIYDSLLEDPFIKIRGKEVHTIDRIYYKDELSKILEKQAEYHERLSDKNILDELANKLYKNNINHRNNLRKKSIIHLLVEDIIFYQRPLKSKKHLVANCKYESYKCKKDDEYIHKPIKVIAKSHPLFQEYRIWSLIHNIRILKREFRNENNIILIDFDVTNEFLNNESKAKLFQAFDEKTEISQSQFLKVFGLKKDEYRWNYEEEIKLKGNETKAEILKAIKGIGKEKETKVILNNPDKFNKIWHALYSLTENEQNLKTGLSHSSIGLDHEAIEAIVKLKPFNKDYGSLSQKAIAKMLPLMRAGKYWDSNAIDASTGRRIQALITGEVEESLSTNIRDKLLNLESVEHFQALPEWVASYVVYNRHSEMGNTSIYESPEDMDVSKLIPQHSLRNPTVEKILRETLLVVRDIWKQYGKPSEIHVELARELKLPAKKRNEYTIRRNENKRTNDRAKAMLRELQKENSNVNPFSIGQLELFKLYEEGATNNTFDLEDDIKVIKRKGDPTASELQRYKLWLDQKYISPYTGQPIPLSKLFTSDYEIEHIIPKSKYYDNSFTNKIICERSANKLKDNRTAYQFICELGGSDIGNGVTILTKENYEALIFRMYKGNRSKIRNLLSLEVPKSFISRQLNDTRYISKKLLELLDPVVRDKEDKDNRSRHILPMVGGITNQLKNSWGLHDVWKRILAPRFIRMNDLTNSSEFYEEKDNKIQLSGNETDLKRLDHRHHALDALIIACTSRQHIQYLSSYQNEKMRYDLIPKLFVKNEKGHDKNIYLKPWISIASDAYETLSKTIVSFKQNNRVINRTNNYYQKYVKQNDKMVKAYVRQEKSADFWAIRKPMHKDTIFGKRSIREYKEITIANALNDIDSIANSKIKSELKKRLKLHKGDKKRLAKELRKSPLIIDGNKIVRVKIIQTNSNIASSRSVLDTSFDKKKIINKVLGGNTKQILLNHLLKYNDNPEEAFSPNGISDLNKSINIPIHKVTLYEDLGKKFSLGDKGINSKKYAEAAKGTNLFFIIYKNLETGEHLITKDSTLSFGDAVKLMKENLPLAPMMDNHTFFFLSPGDLVYAFDEEDEFEMPNNIDPTSIYKCVSFTKHSCFFISYSVANPILNKVEFSALNKQEKSMEGSMIKSRCLKLTVDRLGNIKR